MGFHHVGQAGLELPTSGDPSTLASQGVGIGGMSHRAQGYFILTWSLAVLPRLECGGVSQLTATPTSQVQVILLPQPPE